MKYLSVCLVCIVSVSLSCQTQSPQTPAKKRSTSSSSTSQTVEPKDTSSKADILAAVAHPERPLEDRNRDKDRKPAEVLSYFQVKPKMTVVDLMSGRGYYAEILARLVGTKGKVYLHNNKFVWERFAEGPVTTRMSRINLPQLVRLDSELDQLQLPEQSVDFMLMALFYHDTYWQGTDRAAMNREIFEALKPGGMFGVIDHHAKAGAGTSVVKTLHRVEAGIVKNEILKAGFELVGESDLLSHPEDTHTVNVFDQEIRGKTDRFVFLFRKPLK